MAGKEDDSWLARKEELSRLKGNNEALPNHWDMEDGLLYYKDRLFIPANEDLLTEIAKGCHDSKVAGHFGQEKSDRVGPEKLLLGETNGLDKRLCPMM